MVLIVLGANDECVEHLGTEDALDHVKHPADDASVLWALLTESYSGGDCSVSPTMTLKSRLALRKSEIDIVTLC